MEERVAIGIMQRGFDAANAARLRQALDAASEDLVLVFGGVQSQMQSQVFDLFTQVDHASGQADGLGIGLALVRQLVILHQGAIQLKESTVGQGSTFLVRLPCIE